MDVAFLATTVAFVVAVVLWMVVQYGTVRTRGIRLAQRSEQARHEMLLLQAAAARVRRELRSEVHRRPAPATPDSTERRAPRH